MQCRASLTCLALIVLISAPLARSQEWTRFRGPNGAGQSEATTIPAAWGPQDYLWKVELPGQGNSSPVLWGERIFLTSADPDDGTRHVLCLSARDGRTLWQQDFPSQTHRVHQQNTLASSTPAVDGDRRVLRLGHARGIDALGARSRRPAEVAVELGPVVSQHGFGTSPIVYGELVILTVDQDSDSFVIAVDRASGEVRWKAPRKVHPEFNASYAAPCILHRDGAQDQLITSGWAHGVTSIDPANGRTNWEAAVLERRPVGSPIIFDNLMLANCGEGSGNNTVVAVRPPSAAGSEPEVVYTIDKTSAPYVPSLVAYGRLVFLWGDQGIVTCIDGNSGKIQWRERVGGNYFSSPVRVADRVYCVSVDGEVVALAAANEYKLLGRSPLGETSRATPAIAGGRMFLRTESHLVAVGQE